MKYQALRPYFFSIGGWLEGSRVGGSWGGNWWVGCGGVGAEGGGVGGKKWEWMGGMVVLWGVGGWWGGWCLWWGE